MQEHLTAAEPAAPGEEESRQKKIRGVFSSGGMKITMLIILVLLLLIPVSMIRSLINERSYRAVEAEELIMEAWGSQLALYGPFIRIPVVEKQEIRTKTEKEGEKLEIVLHEKVLWITPKDLNIKADLSAPKKRRGIFSVALFSGEVSLAGSFNFEQVKSELKLNQTAYPQQAEIILGLANQKGIRRVIVADWNGSGLFFKPGTRDISFSSFFKKSSGDNGINAQCSLSISGLNTFHIKFAVQGGKSLYVLPVGETTKMNVRSDWPSPSYQGGFLPAAHTFSESGFDAEWEISYLSRSIPLFFWSTGKSVSAHGMNMHNEIFGVDFFKPLDHYALNERAIKYAILFLIVPFLTLFFLELFSQKQLHAAQYLLCGLANIIFYLLLLSISEHVSFSLAYLIAASALTLMMALYVRSLIETWIRSVYMGLVMALLYLILYVTLNAEDWALLIGSVVAFVICAAVMFLTRKLDWNNLKMKTEN